MAMSDHDGIRRDTAANWTSINPPLFPGEFGYETDTGKLKVGDESFSLWNSLGYFGSTVAFSVNSGITASVTQTQGQGPLTADINEVSTVANDGDTVTLRTAAVGDVQIVMNNGANNLRIFPASGDNLGAGLNAQMTIDLAPGDMVTFWAYDATNFRGAVQTMES